MKTKTFNEQAKEFKEALIQEICQYCTCAKPGGYKPRPALFKAPKGVYVRTLYFLVPQKVIAILPGYVVTVDRKKRIWWNEMDQLPIESLLAIEDKFRTTNKWQANKNNGLYWRIFDPFWFMIPEKANENLMKVLNETQEHYVQSFKSPNEGE